MRCFGNRLGGFQEGEDGKSHPCAYTSRVLKPSEVREYQRRKCVYELELKALIHALDKWRYLLEGQIGTTVSTDHQSLIWLKTQTELTKAQTQFLDTLAKYDLNIKYIKGELNVPGDAPSRRPDYADVVKNYMSDATLDDFEAARTEIRRLEKELKELRSEGGALGSTHNLKVRPSEKDTARGETMAALRRNKGLIRLVNARISQLSSTNHRIQTERTNQKSALANSLLPQQAALKQWLTRLEDAYAQDSDYAD